WRPAGCRAGGTSPAHIPHSGIFGWAMTRQRQQFPEVRDAEVNLDIEGMTCAGCAARVERALNRLDGVQASVNLATERATVRGAVDADADRLVAAVQATGYDARPSAPAAAIGADRRPAPAADGGLRARLVAALVLTVPVAILAM